MWKSVRHVPGGKKVDLWKQNDSEWIEQVESGGRGGGASGGGGGGREGEGGSRQAATCPCS